MQQKQEKRDENGTLGYIILQYYIILQKCAANLQILAI